MVISISVQIWWSHTSFVSTLTVGGFKTRTALSMSDPLAISNSPSMRSSLSSLNSIGFLQVMGDKILVFFFQLGTRPPGSEVFIHIHFVLVLSLTRGSSLEALHFFIWERGDMDLSRFIHCSPELASLETVQKKVWLSETKNLPCVRAWIWPCGKDLTFDTGFQYAGFVRLPRLPIHCHFAWHNLALDLVCSRPCPRLQHCSPPLSSQSRNLCYGSTHDMKSGPVGGLPVVCMAIRLDHWAWGESHSEFWLHCLLLICGRYCYARTLRRVVVTTL